MAIFVLSVSANDNCIFVLSLSYRSFIAEMNIYVKQLGRSKCSYLFFPLARDECWYRGIGHTCGYRLLSLCVKATSRGEGSCLFPDVKSFFCVLCLLCSTACPLHTSTNLFSQPKEILVRYSRFCLS